MTFGSGGREVEMEELVQGQGWDEIQISTVLVQGLSHDWLRPGTRTRLFHPDPFFNILQLGALFHQPSLLSGNTFWGATFFMVRPERRGQMRWLSWALSSEPMASSCWSHILWGDRGESYSRQLWNGSPLGNFPLNCCQLKDDLGPRALVNFFS